MSASPGRPALNRVRTVLLIGGVTLAAVAAVLWLMLPRPPSARVTPLVLTGEAVKSVLLDNTELAGLLGQHFSSTPRDPLYGGLEQMDDSQPAGDCAGVIDVAIHSVYRRFDVRAFAQEIWVPETLTDYAAPAPPAHAKTPHEKLMFVKESVVALPSAEDARMVFDRFVEQWRSCDGQPSSRGRTVIDADEPPLLPGTQTRIKGVRVTDTVLSASVVLDKMPDIPDVRAVGVQDNCIVGVLLPFTKIEDPAAVPDPQRSGVEVVQAMMAKVTAQLG